jgi:hypothetical protein
MGRRREARLGTRGRGVELRNGGLVSCTCADESHRMNESYTSLPPSPPFSAGRAWRVRLLWVRCCRCSLLTGTTQCRTSGGLFRGGVRGGRKEVGRRGVSGEKDELKTDSFAPSQTSAFFTCPFAGRSTLLRCSSSLTPPPRPHPRHCWMSMDLM